MSEKLLDRPFAALLDELASPAPGPAGGSAAALALSLAASLVAMVARASTDVWPDAAGVAAQAERLRVRAVRLADEGAAAFAAAVVALRPADDARPDDFELGRALTAAGEPPLRMAELAADVASLAALTARSGEPDGRPDAVVAATLAAGCGVAGAHLVEVNLALGEGDPQLERAREAARAAQASRDAALGDDARP